MHPVLNLWRKCFWVLLTISLVACSSDDGDGDGTDTYDTALSADSSDGSDGNGTGDTASDSAGGSDAGDSTGSTTDDTDDTGPTVDTQDIAGDENWEMVLTADNYFEVYFGTPLKTEGELVGVGDNWREEFTFTAEGKKPTDHLYVVTASDQNVAQGFIGMFTNVTRGKSVATGDDVWQVFAAGAYEATNPYWPDPWPADEMPTQAQVDAAITYAHQNQLWVTPFSDAAYNNNPDATVPADSPWTFFPWTSDYPNIPDTALWIWHDSGLIADGNMPGPFLGGYHNEFLIFRVAGKVEIVVE